jgi:hypothetical protein
MIRNGEQVMVCNDPGVELLNALSEVALFRAALVENNEDPHRSRAFGHQIVRLVDTVHEFQSREIAVHTLPDAPWNTITKVRSLDQQPVGATKAVRGYMSWELLATEGRLGLYRPLARFARPFTNDGTTDPKVNKRLRFDVSPIFFDPNTGERQPSVAIVVS